MSRRSLAPFAVIATAVVFAGCSPDPTTAPLARPTLKGPSATIANLTNATVIFDQRSTMPTGNGLGNGRFSIYAADDFDVPSTWKLTEVVVSGILTGPTLTFSIRENLINEHPTIPGATYSTPGATVASFTMAPTASDPNLGATDAFPARDYLFKLPTSVTLAKGHYWLTVLVNDFDAGAGESRGVFIWQQYPSLNGYPGAFSLDAEATSWATSLGNVAFVLFGEVLQKPQTITFPAITPNPSPVGTSASLAATATSGLTVVYTSLSTGFCTVDNTTKKVSFTAVGTCTVAADQAGDASWVAAGRKTQSVEVSKGSQTITFTSKVPTGVFVGARWLVTAAGGPSGNPVTFSSLSTDVCTVTGANLVFVGGGKCIVAADQAGSADYNAAPQATQEIPVDKLEQTIQFTSTPPSPAYALQTYDVTATGGGSNNPVTFSSQSPNVCTVAASTVTFKIGGQCVVAADQQGNSAYLAASQKTQSFSVIKISQKVNQSNLPGTAVVGSSMTPVAASTSGLVPVVLTAQPSAVCVMIGAQLKFVGVGVCTVSATQAGDAVYNPSPTANFTVNVVYGFEGFASPVKNDGVLNSAKAGQSIPLAWRLVDGAGTPVTNLTTATITATDLKCALGSTEDQIAESAAGGSGLQNLGNGYYQMNWKTPASYKGSCKTITLTLGSGGSFTVLFQFTK